jgi:hypothetical protein
VCCNHSNNPNCHTLFDKTADGMSQELVVRALTKIEPGEEITIAYLDTAVEYAELRAELRNNYFFDCGAEDERGFGGPAAVDPERVAAIAAKYSTGGNAPAVGIDAADGMFPPTPPPRSAAGLVDVVTDAMDALVEASKFKEALVAGEDCLYLYRACYRLVHPRVALRMLSMGLVALKAADLSKASELLKKAVRLMGITHGLDHQMVRTAKETLTLVEQLSK